jgi:hypothetical protein
MALGTTNGANTREGIFGFFSRMFSTSSYTSRLSTSSGYVQPSTSPDGDADGVVLCQPVDGVACQSMAGAVACQPVEGIACQPVTMVPVLGPQS